MTATPRCICFDLDGTLVDSRAAIVGCFQESLEDHGVRGISNEAIAGNIGRPLAEMLEGLVPVADQPPILEQYSARFPEWDRKCSRVFPGVRASVEQLRERSEFLLITSSKSRRGIVRVLDEQHLAQWFDGIWGGDMVERGKPHPEMILRAMASVGVTASETLLVGDTTYDIDMGVAAGVQSWGVSWGMHDVARLQAAGATRIIETGEALGA